MAKKLIKKATRKVTRPVRKVVSKYKPKTPKAIRSAKKVKSLAKTSTKNLINRASKKALRSTVTLSKKAILKLYKSTKGVDIYHATKPQLRQVISNRIKLLNEAYPTMNNASKRTVERLMKYMGVDPRTGLIADSTQGDLKKELLKKADLLGSALSGDGVSVVAKMIKDYATEQAYNSFMKGATGRNLEGLSFDEYKSMMGQAGRIQDLLHIEGAYEYKDTGDGGKIKISKFREIDKLAEFGPQIGYETVGDIFEKVYSENRGRGLNDKQLENLLVKELQKVASGKR